MRLAFFKSNSLRDRLSASLNHAIFVDTTFSRIGLVEVLATVAIQLSSDIATTDDNLYKGFRLEIEIRPYTDTVNQNKAVAKNQSGIVTLETDWSFASDPNILIRELQFRIDTENLVSY